MTFQEQDSWRASAHADHAVISRLCPPLHPHTGFRKPGDYAFRSQERFFILVGDASHLDGTFAAFGRVTKGMEIADEINKMPVENEKPKNPVRLKRAIVANCPAQSNQQPAVSSQQ